MRRKTFSWKPSLEGSLAIFNVLSLLAFVFLAKSMNGAVALRPYETAITIWLWVLSLPISLFCFALLFSGSGSGIEIVLLCAAAGVNAIVWGRGVAWVLRRTLLARFVSAIEEEERSGEQPDDAPPGPPAAH